MRGSEDWRSVGGGGDGVDGVGGGGDGVNGVGGEGGAGDESGAGDGAVGDGDGSGGGVGGAAPSTLREEKVATFCLAVVVTLRLPEAGGGEGWIRRGSSILVEIVKLGLVKIFKLTFCRNADIWLRL